VLQISKPKNMPSSTIRNERDLGTDPNSLETIGESSKNNHLTSMQSINVINLNEPASSSKLDGGFLPRIQKSRNAGTNHLYDP
jgi:hypothetical protein